MPTRYWRNFRPRLRSSSWTSWPGVWRAAPLAYLRGLARRAKVGDFTPELALRVAGARKRRRQVEAALHRAEAACEKDLAANATNKDDPLVRRLATLRSRLKGPEGNGG